MIFSQNKIHVELSEWEEFWSLSLSNKMGDGVGGEKEVIRDRPRVRDELGQWRDGDLETREHVVW